MSSKNIVDDFDWENNTWDVIDTFFKQNNILINHHLTSFNHFMEKDIQSIVREKEFSTVKVYNKDKYDEEKELYKEIYEIEFGKVHISKPVLYDKPNKYMYPSEARLRKLTYGANIYLDIHHRTINIRDNGEKVVENHPTLEKYPCGRIPIMVGSKFCILNEQSNLTKCEMGEGLYDDGGYFIVKGSEKVIISQEKVCENKICCFPEKTSQSKFSDKAEIWSVNHNSPSIVSKVIVRMKIKKDNQADNVIRVRMKRFKQDIPLIIVFRALNYISDKSITELIVYNTSSDLNYDMIDLLNASIDEAKQVNSQKLALEYISKYLNGLQINKYKTSKCRLKYTFEVLVSDLCPHVGNSPIKKAMFLGHMVNKMLRSHLKKEYDDRDSFLNKRVETSGELMAQLFRAYFGRFNKELKMECDKDMLAGRMSELPQNLTKKLKPNAIERDINYCIGTGTWGLKNKNPRKGIAAVLQRLSYLQTLSSLRRVVAQFDKNGKLTEPRKLHCTQWGVICPFETPEGSSIGIVKNMALTCTVTVPCATDTIISCLEENDVIQLEEVNPVDVFDSVKVFVNGDWYGQSRNPEILVPKLKKYRRQGIINPYISISWYIDIGEIQIWTDGGRMCRPLYIVEDNKLNITDNYIKTMKEKNYQWKNLIHNESNDTNGEKSKHIIEYIDVNESDTLMISMSKDNLDENSKENYAYYNYTHCEIHPSMILGVLASNIPFADHNQAPRNLFQGAMGKQAMGIYSTSFRERMDTMAHILHYPQKPIVNTESSKYVHSDTLPSGQMPIIAIACYTGYNQEDSLIFNQSSIDRGLFSSSFYRTYVDEEKKNSATLEDEKFCKPQKHYPNGKIYTEKMSYGSYDKLDNNGLVKTGEYVDANDIIIGKVTMLKDSIEGEPKARDLSTSLRMNESGIVDKIYKNSNGDGYNFVKVRVRSDRIPEIGDKFSSRHGQKGTIGMTYKQEDMPFTKDGIVPDIIMNPNAIPKRMTIAQFIECVFGKVGTLAGCDMDATPFRKVNVEDISPILEKMGYSGGGTEVLYNGKTGEQIKVNIFIGPTFYYRLKHLVEDKIHSRATGPYQLLTMQPAEGRSRDGGLRCGEMERDCLLSHGAVQFLKERTFDCSDKYYIWIDKETGMISPVNPEKNIYKSLYSDNQTRFAKVQIPYGSKLFIQELQSMHINPRIFTK
jgi:DNA-directed RNA polymerase II subunit RPB2|tara:strand:+ start:3109 stop:6654 length:3546 start_codon:yes stop_codon:yes gene_type:complete